MRYRNAVTGLVVSTETELGYPYDRLHETVNCWCEPVSEWVCHCDRTFTTEQGLTQHQRLTHSDEEE